jgi:hypothetical protein
MAHHLSSTPFGIRDRFLPYIEMRPVWVGEIKGEWVSEQRRALLVSEIFGLEQSSAIPHKTAESRDYTECVHFNDKLG